MPSYPTNDDIMKLLKDDLEILKYYNFFQNIIIRVYIVNKFMRILVKNMKFLFRRIGV